MKIDWVTPGARNTTIAYYLRYSAGNSLDRSGMSSPIVIMPSLESLCPADDLHWWEGSFLLMLYPQHLHVCVSSSYT